MQKKYIFVVNPISGGKDKEDLIKKVHDFGQEAGIEMLVFETSGNNDKEELKALYKATAAERIIIGGGDGTIKMVAESLENEDVILGIIPAGSANGLSADLNFPKALDEQLKIAFFNDFVSLDMVCINDKRSLHLSDLGLNAELISNYEQSAIRGKLGYAIQAVSTLTDEEIPFVVTIEANDTVVKTEAKMVVIANSQKYGTGVIINPLGKINDGKFEIVILKDFNLGIFSKIVAGNMPLDTGEVEIISTAKAMIQSDIPVDFQIDGEYCGKESQLKIYILPQTMKVAVPEGWNN